MNIEISGNKLGPTVFFLAGWPDSSDVFRTNIMAHLAKDYRIVGLTLPGYADDSPFMRSYRKGFADAHQARRKHEARVAAKAGRYRSRARRLGRQLRLARERVTGLLFKSTTVAATSTAATNPSPSRGLGGMPNASTAMGGGQDTNGVAADSSDSDTEEAIDLVRYQLYNGDSPMQTPHFGHSFHDLVRLLEIAVDVAMASYNDCPPAFLASTLEESENAANGVPAHQLPPYYPRPVIIAHGWGVPLVFELLLSRPTYFSRIVALDAGVAAFDRPLRGSLDTPSHRFPSRRTVGEPPVTTPITPFTGAAAASSSSKPQNGHNGVSAWREHRNSQYNGVFARENGTQGDPPAPAAATAGQQLLSLGSSSVSQALLAEVGGGVAAGEGDVLPEYRHRSLASQYAIRPAKANAGKTTNTRKLWQRLCIFIYQLLVIACTFTMPRFAARWILQAMLWMAGRPRYTRNPLAVITPENEALNQHLYRQRYYATRYFGGDSKSVSGRWAHHPEFQEGLLAAGAPSELLLGPNGDAMYMSPNTEDFTIHSSCRSMQQPGSPHGIHPRMSIPSAHMHAFRNCSFTPPADDWLVMLVPFLRGNHTTPPSQPHQKDSAGSHLHDGSSTTAPHYSVGFTLASESRLGGSAVQQLMSVESVTAVSPYHAYRDSTHVIYDSPLPSVAMQGKYTDAGIAMDAWHPKGSVSDHHESVGVRGGRSGQRWQCRGREVYYRSFVIPAPAAPQCVDDDLELQQQQRQQQQQQKNQQGPFHWRRRPVLETPVEVQSTMGWIYLQYWWGCVLSFLFAPSQATVAPVAGATGVSGGQQSTRAGDNSSSLGGSVSRKRQQCTQREGGQTRSGERPPRTPSDKGDDDAEDVQFRGAHSPLVSQRFFFRTQVPILYMYGGNKVMMLHSDQWCEYVKEEKGVEDGISDVVEVKGGGHWFFAEPKYQRKVAERIADFITAKTH